MPWVPELFSAPALAHLEAKRHRKMVDIPYFDGFAMGEVDALVESFAGEPRVQHPLRGTIEGEYEFREFVGATANWLKEHDATIEDVHRGVLERRGFEEVVVHFGSGADGFGLPHAMVADHSPDGRIEELRIYFSTRALTGHRAERSPLLAADPALREPPPVAEYERALAAGDAEAVAAAFEADGYAREPDGADRIHRGGAAVRAFFADQLAGGGIALERCVLVEDGEVCALEYNAARRGDDGDATPQAGLTVYERGPGGRLAAARIYDDLAPPR
jgi:SnoaL-like protein